VIVKLLESIQKKLNLVIIEVNGKFTSPKTAFNMLNKCSLKKKNRAWPGKVEMLYFLFTICWNTFRALKISNTNFLSLKSSMIQLHFKRLGNQQETKDIGAF
jgi:hypothetical protein